MLRGLVLSVALFSASALCSDPSVLALTLFNKNIYPRALCNDGSSSGYFVQRNTSSSNWLIALDGGFWCWDTASCADRAKQTPNLVSSNAWPNYRSFGGIFSRNASHNPDFAYDNKVFLGYCSSDMYMGNTTHGANGWGFNGRHILTALFDELQAKFNINGAQRLVFSGCSAGGQAVVTNVNFVGQLLYNNGFQGQFFGIADAGWMVDMQPVSSKVTPIRDTFRLGYQLWNAPFPEVCGSSFSDRPWMCYFTANMMPYVAFPLLVQGSEADAFQLPYNLNQGPPYSGAALDWITGTFVPTIRFQMRKTVTVPNAAFSPDCFSHCLTFDDEFWLVRVRVVEMRSRHALHNDLAVSDGTVSMRDTVHGFISENPQTHLANCQGFNCSAVCP
eukprot:comp20174_c0_seq1/m.39873 comp20174_c0_seq1/g.39873  ORF comp20174_c0_seq1/g.39873 comp20174_c0_seq1/m.39873 type:complete len:389 (-) comp20174_c0_seq1:17-1183(-)